MRGGGGFSLFWRTSTWGHSERERRACASRTRRETSSSITRSWANGGSLASLCYATNSEFRNIWVRSSPPERSADAADSCLHRALSRLSNHPGRTKKEQGALAVMSTAQFRVSQWYRMDGIISHPASQSAS